MRKKSSEKQQMVDKNRWKKFDGSCYRLKRLDSFPSSIARDNTIEMLNENIILFAMFSYMSCRSRILTYSRTHK